MAQLLLVGKDWQARALLRAQLLEEGVEVEAYESVESALGTIEATGLLPSLILADLSASDDPSTEADQLAGWARRISIWIIASRHMMVSRILNGRGFGLVLVRPVDMGELVEQIKQKLGSSPPARY